MKIELNPSRQIAFGLSVALLVLIVISVVAYRSTVQFAESTAQAASAHRLILSLESLMNTVMTAETEARGYAISGDDQFLAHHRAAVEQIQMELKEPLGETGNPDLKQRVSELEQLIRERLARFQVVVETRQLKGPDAVRGELGPGKKLTDDLRRLAADIEGQTRQHLFQYEHAAKTASLRTTAVVIVGGFFAPLLVIVCLVVLISAIAQRERLEKRVLEISGHEQRRIGQDLHDGVCQQLTVISQFGRKLQEQLSGRLADQVEEMGGMIDSCIDQTRRITRGLHPVPDEPTGLVMALSQLAQTVRLAGKVDCEFECPQLVSVYDQTTATNLYRIAQEAVQNALRHAGATRIVITLREDDRGIDLSIADDGRGLPADRARKGLGLEIMSFRAQTVGARVTAKRGAECGTIVHCALPRQAKLSRTEEVEAADEVGQLQGEAGTVLPP